MENEDIDAITNRKLSDVGTRYDHYSDLVSLFETGTELLTERLNANKSRNRIADLDNLFLYAVAAKAVRGHLDILSGYSDSVQQYKLGKEIDGVSEEAKVWRDK